MRQRIVRRLSSTFKSKWNLAGLWKGLNDPVVEGNTDQVLAHARISEGKSMIKSYLLDQWNAILQDLSISNHCQRRTSSKFILIYFVGAFF